MISEYIGGVISTLDNFTKSAGFRTYATLGNNEQRFLGTIRTTQEYHNTGDRFRTIIAHNTGVQYIDNFVPITIGGSTVVSFEFYNDAQFGHGREDVQTTNPGSVYQKLQALRTVPHILITHANPFGCKEQAAGYLQYIKEYNGEKTLYVIASHQNMPSLDGYINSNGKKIVVINTNRQPDSSKHSCYSLDIKDGTVEKIVRHTYDKTKSRTWFG